MPKSKVQKQGMVDEIAKKLADYKGAVFADYKGLTVAESSAIRKLCRKEGAQYLVAKKTLIKLALEKAGINDVDVKSLKGNVAMVIGFEDEIAPAKIVANFNKQHENLKLIGGLMENKFINLEQVMALSKIPSKVELLTRLVLSLNSPVSGFVNVLAANIRGLLNALNAIKEQKV